jgi:hypothetical protein
MHHRAFVLVAPILLGFAFLDAATVKRTFVARGARLAGSN